ncbi:hypothetical protein [Clostridium saccharobutylicum]|uniref:Transposase n=1 Tax=Clostridium saccharobutylicum TaxID=169679 RepID=A0A1S8NBW4_CLOSA|nr:hypothetical protein [Clostridium saccharobutylicum]OOM13976.1 hypothetical protein CLOSAC_20620 [Clostridium saccharobutylicum]
MTELGRSLFEEGKLEGKQENAMEVAKRAIRNGISNELISKLTELSIDQIEVIRKTIKSN